MKVEEEVLLALESRRQAVDEENLRLKYEEGVHVAEESRMGA